MGKLSFAVAAAAAAVTYLKYKEDPEKVKKFAYDGADLGIRALLKGVDALLPSTEWQHCSEFESRNFLQGQAKLLDAPAAGAAWRLGYACESLTPEDYETEDYFIGGFLRNPPNKMDGVLDDIRVRAVCLDDGSGRGAVAFAVLDCIGMSNTDVREIRGLLEDITGEGGLSAVNVSCIHCHSSIDTMGLWGRLKDDFWNNVSAVKNGRYDECRSGRNEKFMSRLHAKTAAAIRSAFEGMQSGKLYSTVFDDLEYSRAKRSPHVRIKDIVKLRFAPSDGGRETVGVFMAAHPVSVGEDNTKVSADYVYYMDEAVRAEGSNFIFFQGAQLAVATNRGCIDPDRGGYAGFGTDFGKYLLSLDRARETEVLPLLNVHLHEILLGCDNGILVAAAKLHIVNNTVVQTGYTKNDLSFLTEIGLVELGNNLALALVPGELAPELAVGGANNAQTSYNKTDWNFPSLQALAGTRHLTVLGLCNDSVGYILPDNDYGSVVAPEHYEEAVSAGKKTGSAIINAFINLFDDVAQSKSL